MIHSEGRGILLTALRSDVTLFIHGLQPFVYFHPGILKKKLKKKNEDKIFPKVEIYEYKHSWRFLKFFKKFMYSEIPNIRMFEAIKDFQTKSYYSFRSHIKNYIGDELNKSSESSNDYLKLIN